MVADPLQTRAARPHSRHDGCPLVRAASGAWHATLPACYRKVQIGELLGGLTQVFAELLDRRLAICTEVTRGGDATASPVDPSVLSAVRCPVSPLGGTAG